MQSYEGFLILVLATFRLTLMVTQESGPGWIFKRFRKEVKAKAPKATHLDEGISCPWCVSVWFAALIAAANYMWAGHPAYEAVLLLLALSGGAVVLTKLMSGAKS